ncbi:MAG: glycosyl hydrolase family 28-related protein [Bryobacteraceae bacterium]|nr:glycosyl hydrolase family 28-related protein [Bryobacteraceae bacterium]
MTRPLILALLPTLLAAQAQPPDFSWAGYHSGEAPIPRAAVTASVRDFGAVGDGEKDDTAAFLKAIEATTGVIRVPAGRYKITGILDVKKSGVVIRGDGPDKTTLFFPTPLSDIRPDWGATTGGQRTSNYSWAGGFIWFRGSFGNRRLATVASESARGATVLKLSSTQGLKVGQKIQIAVRDDEAKTLSSHLYSEDPGDMKKLDGTRTSIIVGIRSIRAESITIDRPLRFDIRAAWKPEVLSFEPTVTECGVEDLRFEFPAPEYKGHFTELGQNPVALQGVADCWVRNIRLTNPDSGPFISGSFNTVDGIVYESARTTTVKQGFNGHHGMYIGGDDNLFTNFDIRMKFIHDLSVSHGAGNVISNGKGVDLAFDHHKRAPYENLYTNIDAGAGTRPWMSGGGDALGRHCGARETFWNIHAAAPLKPPPAGWAPGSIILSGLAPERVEPVNLHTEQLARRLRKN